MSSSSEEVRGKVAEVINRVLTDSGRRARQLKDDDSLTRDIGLDSLDLAVLVVGLEQSVGVDPFRSGSSAVATYGELVTLYANALEGIDQTETGGGA